MSKKNVETLASTIERILALTENVPDYWAGSRFRELSQLPGPKRGVVVEQAIGQLLQQKGLTIARKKQGADYIIHNKDNDSLRFEIKSRLHVKKQKRSVTFSGVRPTEFDAIFAIAIMPNDVRMWLIPALTIRRWIKEKNNHIYENMMKKGSYRLRIDLTDKADNELKQFEQSFSRIYKDIETMLIPF